MKEKQMKRFVKEGLLAGLIGIRERNKLDLTEKRTIELIVAIFKKKIITKTPLAHKVLLKLGKKFQKNLSGKE
jgi:hypothetical protein